METLNRAMVLMVLSVVCCRRNGRVASAVMAPRLARVAGLAIGLLSSCTGDPTEIRRICALNRVGIHSETDGPH